MAVRHRAQCSTLPTRAKPIDVKRVGRELGVRYVLEGSVRKGGRVRITAQLIEAETAATSGPTASTARLKTSLHTVAQVAISVAGVIEPAFAGGRDRAVGQPSDKRSQRLRRLSARSRSPPHKGKRGKTLVLLEEAIARDPYYGPALGFAAICCMLVGHRRLRSGSRCEPRRKGIDLGRRAVGVAGNTPRAYWPMQQWLSPVSAKTADAMIALVDRALAFNPSYARGWHVSGLLRLWAGATGSGDRACR